MWLPLENCAGYLAMVHGDDYMARMKELVLADLVGQVMQINHFRTFIRFSPPEKEEHANHPEPI